MAEGQGNAFTQFLSHMNPITRVREMGSNWRNHPGQTAATTALGLVPIAGPALSGIARMLFQNGNNSNTNQAMTDQIRGQNEELSNQIFPPNSPSQSPGMGGMASPGPSMGSAGPSGGMAGITSPWQGQSSQQSPLLQMLGINTDYSGGGNAGPVAAPGGSTGANLLGMIHSSGNPINGASTSLAGNGATVGTATMGQVEDMLGAGIGRNDRANQMTQGREMSEYRDARRGQQRPQGMSVKDWLMQ